MALRPFNSLDGFSVGESPKINVIYANGDGSFGNLTVLANSYLGEIANVQILGGMPGQGIVTDGNGNLSFETFASSTTAAPMPYFIPTGNTAIVADTFQGLFSYPITIDGVLEVDGLLIEVGTPINANNYQIVYNSDSTLSGNAGFTFIPDSGNLYVPGNIVPSGDIIPRINVQSSLGSYTNRFSNLWLSGNTITLSSASGLDSTISTTYGGNIVLTSGGGGNLQVQGNTTVTTIQTGNTSIDLTANGNIDFTVTGVPNVVTITQNGLALTGNVDFSSSPTVLLGPIGNVKITGGNIGQILTTDGNGNLTWSSTPTNITEIQNGRSNVSIPNQNGNVYINANNGSNFQWIFDTTGNLTTTTGNINIPGNVVSNGTITGDYLISTSGCVSIGNGTLAVIGSNAGVFNSGVTNINIGVAANVVIGSTTGTVTTQNDFVSNGIITTTNTVISNNISVGDLYSKRAPIAVPSNNTIIDTFPISAFRSAKYTIKSSCDIGYQALEVLLLQDSINTYITVYASLSSAPLGAETILVTANITSGNVNLLASPYSSNTVVNLMGTYVPD